MTIILVYLILIYFSILKSETLFGPYSFESPTDFLNFDTTINTSNIQLNCYQGSQCITIANNEYIANELPISTLNYQNISCMFTDFN